MLSILARIFGVVAALGAVALVIWAPWDGAGGPPGEATVAVTENPGQPIDDFSNASPHELIRYDMPLPTVRPKLEEGATPLGWADLWQDGELKLEADDKERVGRPSLAEFPAGTSAEDVLLFFLDIGDMRDMQAHIGSVRADLDGKRVRLAGYTTPVGFSPDETRFLLVPELGACIHVPPPPPNQIVYVEKADQTPEMFAPVWVTGTLKAAPIATILADVGYQLVDVKAEPYR